jgi:CYTH domain-containing protein/thymidylate kinase
MTNVPVVVVTGGPCGGKSTFMARVRERLEEFGIHVLVVSETATELISAGFSPAVMGVDRFQAQLLFYSLEREQRYLEIARGMEGKNVVILCDRGVLDCAAYMGAEPYQWMIELAGFTQSELMHRYDLVVHLVTAADGAEAHYTLLNNSARKETPEEARALDVRTLHAWLGHPHHIIVDNSSTDFADKMLRALRALARKLNMPQPTEIEKKFLVKNFTRNLIPREAQESRITQDYLVCEGPGERRVRMRVRGEDDSYYYTEKLPTGESGTRIEKERMITRKEYLDLLDCERDPRLLTIKKTRHVFPFAGKVYELDVFEGHLKGLVMLEVELQHKDEEVIIPPDWDTLEVTDDKRYKNRHLAEPTTVLD